MNYVQVIFPGVNDARYMDIVIAGDHSQVDPQPSLRECSLLRATALRR